MSSPEFGTGVIAFILAAQGFALAAEPPELGVLLDPGQVAAIDFTVLPDGDGLPPGAGTAREGAAVFRSHCIACHGEHGSGGVNDALVGGRGSLATGNPAKTIGSYWPYATTVFDYIRRAMPMQSPGTLGDDEVYAVTAYLLYLNGIVEEGDTMNRDTLPRVQMPNRDGFLSDWQP